MDAEFLRAAHSSRTLELNQQQRLELYALYKQALIGQCTEQSPPYFDIISLTKWRAWRALGEMGKEDASRKYIEAVSNFSINQQKVNKESLYKNTSIIAKSFSQPLVFPDTNYENRYI
jgi:peroxisomal 3,2-trans-enoyl-CoA isomerase